VERDKLDLSERTKFYSLQLMAFQLDCVWNHNEVKRKRRMPMHFVAEFQKSLFYSVSTVPTQLLHLPQLTDTNGQLFSRKCFHQLEIIFYIVSINDSSISQQYTGTVSTYGLVYRPAVWALQNQTHFSVHCLSV